MKATLVQRGRSSVGDDLFVEIVIWQVPVPVRGSQHSYKYRMALIDDDRCVMRYDNEAGKGDHKHVGRAEIPYVFSTLDQLADDFRADVNAYIEGGRQ